MSKSLRLLKYLWANELNILCLTKDKMAVKATSVVLQIDGIIIVKSLL